MSLKILQAGTSSDIQAIGLKDGSLITADWIQSLVVRGKVFHAYLGSATTPVTLDASYAATDPDISIDVPDGRLIIPLTIRINVEAYGTTALFETHTLCSRTLAASSAGTAFVPINMRTRTGGGSNCTVYTGPTVTDGHTTGSFELFRETIEKVATVSTGDDDSNRGPTNYEWSIGKAGWAPVLEGDASLQTWVTSQASSGYIQIWWAELEESDI